MSTLQMAQLARTVGVFCLVILSVSVTIWAQPLTAPRGITPEDYFLFEFISDPRIAPDGKLVAYVVTKVDRAQNRRNSAIWMAATDGSRAPWQFTTAPQSTTQTTRLTRTSPLSATDMSATCER